MPIEINPHQVKIPSTLNEVLDPRWIQQALSPVSGGRAVTHVTTVDALESFAAKIRITVQFEGSSDKHHFCVKAFLNADIVKRAGSTAVREALFYQCMAPNISMRVPRAIAHIDQQNNSAILLMEDLIHHGAHFCSALEPFTPELAAQSLDQIARLHAASTLLTDNAWLPNRLSYLATSPHFSASELQKIMDGPRSKPLSRRTANAGLLLEGMKQLALSFSKRPQTVLHGDCHAGNFYLTDEGPGLTDWQLVQSGNWAQDVAYHIASVLPAHVAGQEERVLLAHYLDRLHAYGGTVPAMEQAWEDYRLAQIYGYYHWAITTRVDSEIVNVFMQRLGAGVERHDTYALLGL